ncbi:hypothetical protein GCT19_04165 [Paraburkholderia sp. CNPSo 3155]|uniref:phage major capsid family protein n=1 Tax=Paraburkholderia atlantica TaxID=2654982 RepID=UPI00128BD52B|nr:phage major capsid protein [Paraburkholderia atlantica]MPW04851.1 hypothetical protein [Paraburkholderia atlantica]
MATRYGFIQVARAVALSRGNLIEARSMLAAQHGLHSPQAEAVQRAITTTDSLDNPDNVALQGVAADFVSLIHRRSIIAKIREATAGGFHRVLPYAAMLKQTEGTAAAWVGEALVIPVTDAAFQIERMSPMKVAGMVIVTEEFAKVISDASDAILNRDLARAVADKITETFCSTAAPSDTSPGGIFYHGTEITSTGDLLSDATQLIADFEGDIESAVFVCSPLMAAVFNTLGIDQVGAQGGYICGIPAVTTTGMDDGMLGLIDPSRVKLIDSGVGIDASKQAAVSVANAQGPVQLVSLWQQNLVSMRAVAFVNWALMDASVATWVQDAGAVSRALRQSGKATATTASTGKGAKT